MPRFPDGGRHSHDFGVVHNFLKTDKSTKISLDLTGAQLLDAPSQTVTIRQNGEHRVDWRVGAHGWQTDAAGEGFDRQRIRRGRNVDGNRAARIEADARQ